MAKKRISSKKISKRPILTKQFEIQMRLGILRTIAKSIYSSPGLKIREAVANSMDNSATWFIIYADRSTRTLSFFDNGTGISDVRFKQIFNSLGYGIWRNEIRTHSYFGLGLISIMQLGGRVKIFSRASQSNKIFMLDVNSGEIFDKKNENKPLDFLHECIILKTSDLAVRQAASPLKRNYIEKVDGGYPENFTEIIIENVDKKVFDFMTGESFEFDMRKVLPLKPDKQDPFLSSIKDTKAKEWIQKILVNTKYCPTVDVYFGIEGEREIKKLHKYFPDFKQELRFESTNILYSESDSKDFAYYIIFATEDLEKKQKENPETGFWVRNRNFLVKPADFFQEPGTKKKFIHEPLKNWLFGEVLHQNMNHFLKVTREDYVWNSEDFIKFRDEIINRTGFLNQKLRNTWKYGREIVESVITPIREISESKCPFARVKDTLSKMWIKPEGKNIEEVLEKLKERRKKALENEDIRVDKLMTKNKIVLVDDENSLVMIDPSVKKEENLFTQSLEEGNDQRIVVKISPQLFSPKKVMFLDKTFDLYFASGKENDPGLSVDVDNSKIFVNIFNHDMMKYSVSFIDVHIAVELADIWSKTKTEMKHYVLRLLGAKFLDSSKYLAPLSDDLNRRKRSL